jgi:hypothetical protein
MPLTHLEREAGAYLTPLAAASAAYGGDDPVSAAVRASIGRKRPRGDGDEAASDGAGNVFDATAATQLAAQAFRSTQLDFRAACPARGVLVGPPREEEPARRGRDLAPVMERAVAAEASIDARLAALARGAPACEDGAGGTGEGVRRTLRLFVYHTDRAQGQQQQQPSQSADAATVEQSWSLQMVGGLLATEEDGATSSSKKIDTATHKLTALLSKVVVEFPGPNGDAAPPPAPNDGTTAGTDAVAGPCLLEWNRERELERWRREREAQRLGGIGGIPEGDGGDGSSPHSTATGLASVLPPTMQQQQQKQRPVAGVGLSFPAAEADGIEVHRRGALPARLSVRIHLTLRSRPEQFAVRPRLAHLLDLDPATAHTRAQVLTRLWAYVRAHHCDVAGDPSALHLDAGLRAATDLPETVALQAFSERIGSLLSPPPPVVIEHIVHADPATAREACYDIDVIVPRPAIESIEIPGEAGAEVRALKLAVSDTTRLIEERHRRRAMLRGFSRDPVRTTFRVLAETNEAWSAAVSEPAVAAATMISALGGRAPPAGIGAGSTDAPVDSDAVPDARALRACFTGAVADQLPIDEAVHQYLLTTRVDTIVNRNIEMKREIELVQAKTKAVKDGQGGARPAVRKNPERGAA